MFCSKCVEESIFETFLADVKFATIIDTESQRFLCYIYSNVSSHRFKAFGFGILIWDLLYVFSSFESRVTSEIIVLSQNPFPRHFKTNTSKESFAYSPQLIHLFLMLENSYKLHCWTVFIDCFFLVHFWKILDSWYKKKKEKREKQ